MNHVQVIPVGESAVRSCTFQELENLIQFTYQPTLSFENEKVHTAVRELCASSALENALTVRQRWCGVYYAQEIAKGGYFPDLIVAWINPIVGYGVFAGRDIPPQSYVGSYVGEIKRRPFLRRKRNHYCFDYSTGIFKTPFLIDAEKKGGLIRFINHSGEPNLEAMPVYVEGMLHIIVCATTLIPKGTQLTYEYGEEYWKKRDEPSETFYDLNGLLS